MMIWLLIVLMAFITFFNRYALFSPNLPISVGRRTQALLSYAAPAVLTAMWVPIVFVKKQSLNTDFSDPYLVAGLITMGVSLIIKKPVPVIVIGLIGFLWARVFLS